MLWIHGGCYGYGSAADAEYNATALAEKEAPWLIKVKWFQGNKQTCIFLKGKQHILSKDSYTILYTLCN